MLRLGGISVCDECISTLNTLYFMLSQVCDEWISTLNTTLSILYQKSPLFSQEFLRIYLMDNTFTTMPLTEFTKARRVKCPALVPNASLVCSTRGCIAASCFASYFSQFPYCFASCYASYFAPCVAQARGALYSLYFNTLHFYRAHASGALYTLYFHRAHASAQRDPLHVLGHIT